MAATNPTSVLSKGTFRWLLVLHSYNKKVTENALIVQFK